MEPQQRWPNSWERGPMARWTDTFARPDDSWWQTDGLITLERAQAEWDRVAASWQAFDENIAAKHKEWDTRRAEEATAADAKRRADYDTFVNDLRAGYLAIPGRTEEQFQAALPALLEQHAQRAALDTLAAASAEQSAETDAFVSQARR